MTQCTRRLGGEIEMNPWAETRLNPDGPLLFLFDFDDTLFPSSYLEQEYPDALRAGITDFPRVDLQRLLLSMKDLLCFCCKRGEVRIVSAATERWLELALRRHLRACPVLHKLPVYTSRPAYNQGIFPSKLPLFRDLVEETRCRQVFVIGDGPDEQQAAHLLQYRVPCPVVCLPVRRPKPYLSASAMTHEHRRIRAHIEGHALGLPASVADVEGCQRACLADRVRSGRHQP